MTTQKKIEWALRVGVFGEFLGHGAFALLGKAQWIGWISQMTGADAALAGQLLVAIGVLDVLVAILVLVKPVKSVLIWCVAWGFWTALVRPLVGEPIWDFIERWTNWAAPLALYFLLWDGKKAR